MQSQNSCWNHTWLTFRWASAGEEDAVRKLLLHAPLAVTSAKWGAPATKVNALLQAHLSRTSLSGDLAADQRSIITQATRLLQVEPYAMPCLTLSNALELKILICKAGAVLNNCTEGPCTQACSICWFCSIVGLRCAPALRLLNFSQQHQQLM